MKNNIVTAVLALSVLLLFGSLADVLSQGRGGTRGGGPPAAPGRPMNPGIPAGTRVDTGLGTASARSGGRSDTGLGTASNRSGGHLDDGLDRARHASSRAGSVGDIELTRYRGLSRRFGKTPEDMRALFEAAVLANPDLRFGQFVAAHVIADNLGSRFPLITADNILIGLGNGNSFGRTLRNLGLTKEQARDVERLARDRMRDARTSQP